MRAIAIGLLALLTVGCSNNTILVQYNDNDCLIAKDNFVDIEVKDIEAKDGLL